MCIRDRDKIATHNFFDVLRRIAAFAKESGQLLQGGDGLQIARRLLAAEAAGKSGMRPCYAGREVAASPATGYASRHQVQQEALVNIALGLNGTAPNVRSDCK